ncbi:RhaT Permeases of the drug/metabolite transporter (DMT) superfamily [Rhabdaerophilaceae bacterium]
MLSQARRSVMIGTGFALVGAALYGMNVPAARFASQAGMAGADLIAWRAVLFLPILVVAALVTGERLALRPAERAPTARLAISASLTATFYLSSVDHLPVPIAVVLFYMFPLFIILLSSRIDGKRISAVQMGVFATAFVGLVVAVGPSLAGLSPYGIALAGAAAIACAFMFIFAGRVDNAPIRNAFWTQLVMGPVALLFTLTQGGPVSISVFWAAPIAIAIAMLAYCAAYIFQLMASARISADRAGLLFLFEPVTAVACAGLWLGETLSPLQIGGVVLILMALAAEITLGTRESFPDS